jgi:DNA recombination protein RmuC
MNEMITFPIIPLGLTFVFVLLLAILWLLWRLKADSEQHNSSDNFQESVAFQKQVASLEAERTWLQEQLRQQEKELTRQREQFLAEQAAHGEVKLSLERINATLSSERKQFEEKQNTFKVEFQNLANKIMEEKSAKFTEQNKTNLDALMNPLREQIVDFKKKIEDTYDKESKDRTSLFEQIKQLQVLNTQLSEDAHNLTKALKGSSKTQGNWGELILETILEQSGLEKGREYETQSSFSKSDLDSNQKRYQPDVLIHLPESKTIIVDSKVSLTAYEKFCSAEDDNEKKSSLKAHISAVKTRVNELSDKNYHDVDGLNTLDFVVMFMPIEAAFLVAMQNDQSLYNYAIEKNVFIVSPSNLLVMLRTIQHTWRNEKQNQNAIDIADKSGKLYDKFVGFVEDMDAIGSRIDQTKKAWDSGMDKLQRGRGNLINRGEELKKLGAKANKSLPNHMIENDEE